MGSGNHERAVDAYRERLRRRMLMYGFVVSVIGLPVGILLEEPVVWGLALLGLVIGGVTLLQRAHA